MIQQEEIKWKHRSSVWWLEDGDHNGKFFNGVATSLRRVNWISSIMEVDQIWDSIL